MTPSTRLLLVDDCETQRMLLPKLLKKTGLNFEIFSASSAREALENLRTTLKGKIDIALSDFRMPEMDGAQFLQAMQKEFGDDITRVIITAAVQGDGSFPKEVYTCDPHLVLPRPITIEALKQNFLDLIRRQQA